MMVYVTFVFDLREYSTEEATRVPQNLVGSQQTVEVVVRTLWLSNLVESRGNIRRSSVNLLCKKSPKSSVGQMMLDYNLHINVLLKLLISFVNLNPRIMMTPKCDLNHILPYPLSQVIRSMW